MVHYVDNRALVVLRQ
ncbi:rCG60722, partial [Rattus norvegicus]